VLEPDTAVAKPVELPVVDAVLTEPIDPEVQALLRGGQRDGADLTRPLLALRTIRPEHERGQERAGLAVLVAVVEVVERPAPVEENRALDVAQT
jgi:hypothetical protein